MSTTGILNAAIERLKERPGEPRIYKLGKVPADPTYPYTVVNVTGGPTANHDGAGAHGTRVLWIDGRSFGMDVDGANAYDQEAMDLLLDHRLAVAGIRTSPIGVRVPGVVLRDADEFPGVIGVTTVLAVTTTKEIA